MSSKVLIIDDSDQDRKIIKRYLNKCGYEDIVTANTGEEGVKLAKSQDPDLVITDTMMPGIDGFEVCKQIREAKGPERPKIIVVTGAIDAIDAVKARKSGANDYCAKTSDCVALIEAVKSLI
ncbi:response regulator [Candidatus Omnitrophota bacterium]